MKTCICPGAVNESLDESHPLEATPLVPPMAAGEPRRKIPAIARAPTTRRGIVLGISATLGCFRFGRIPSAAAQQRPEKQAGAQSPETTFLELSQALTGHPDLNARTAERMWAAFERTDAKLFADLPAMARLRHDGQTPTELLQSARTAGLGDAALALVTAWYTGTVGSGTKAEVVAYADALMYWPARDAMPPPSYVLGGPAWWVEPPPPVGVSAPPQSAAGKP
jgi:fructose 5-dehydrogenase small subunit